MPIDSDSFTGVDLSRLPAPQVIEQLDFETLYAQALAQFQAYFPSFDATVESDPVVKLIQLFAYRELVLRQRLNDAARAVMPAFATGSDLDAPTSSTHYRPIPKCSMPARSARTLARWW